MIAPAGSKTGTLRAAVYARLSVELPDQELSSVQVQHDRCVAYAASQGWTALDTTYHDDGFSGASVDRPALQRLLRDVEAGEIDVVVTVRIDRLSRSMLDFLKITQTFERYGASLVSITQEVNTGTAWGRMVLNLLAGFGQFERDLISERTRDKISAIRRQGRWSGGVVPLGYDLDGGRLVANEAESLRVAAIFDLYREVGSLGATVEEMTRRGWYQKQWTTKGGVERGGGPFTKNGLYALLTNVLYLGQVRCGDEVVPGEHDSILDPALFEEVGRLLRSNGHKKAGGPRTRNSEAFLRGILYCGHCDVLMRHTFTTKGNKRYRYMTCAKVQTEGWHSCPVKSVAAGDVEAAVLDEVRSAIASDERLLRAVAAEVHRKRRARIAELRREIRIAELEQRSANGTGPQIATRIEKLQGELAALAADRIKDGEVVEAVTEFAPVWDAMTYRERTQVVAAVVERVEYDGTDITITFAEAAPHAR